MVMDLHDLHVWNICGIREKSGLYCGRITKIVAFVRE
jgi:hypothetical protein